MQSYQQNNLVTDSINIYVYTIISEASMSFWNTIGKIIKTAGQSVGQLSVIVHPENNAIELTPFALKAVKTMVEYKSDLIQNIAFSDSEITVTVEKMFITHTLVINEALINIDNNDIDITVHLAKGIPLLLQGVGGQIVATVINSILGISGEASSVHLNGTVITYSMPKSKLGLLSQITLQHTIADTEFFVQPHNSSVIVSYPADGIVKPEIASLFNSLLSTSRPGQISSQDK